MKQEEDAINASKDTDSVRLKSYSKTRYVRHKRLLELVANMNCQHCGHYLSQACHSNWHGGKGKGIKASDEYVAALCQKCHYEVDQGARLSKAERQEMWINAHLKTLHFLLITDQWPRGVPVSDLYLKRYLPLA
jgi:transcription elongation factor Elf1